MKLTCLLEKLLKIRLLQGKQHCILSTYRWLQLSLLALELATALSALLPMLAHTMMATAAAVVQVTVPWHCWWSVAPLRKEDDNSGSADDSASALSAILHLLMQR
jgi:hypothetical protein